MDYCNLESNIDTLELLRPPIKRNNLHKINRTVCVSVNCNPNTRRINCKETTRRKNCKIIKGQSESSTSLKRKTTETRVLKQYSVLSYTSVLKHKKQTFPAQTVQHNISKEKPLIQVTVIPKTEHTQTEKFYKRRRHYPKVHSSVSNQENSINGKTVYLIAACKQREKVHKIKITGSAKFPNNRVTRVIKHEETISNCKQLLKSLNMEVKKKRDKRKKKTNAVPINDNSRERCYDCGCWGNTRDEIQADVNPHKSKVRIYGRVGLTQDDRYVMDYAATVDEKPLHTINYSPLEQNPEVSSVFLGSNDKPRLTRNINKIGCISGSGNNYRPYHRDFNVQTDIRDDPPSFMLGANKPWLNKESQGTQVNFNFTIPNKKHYQTKDQKIHCGCPNLNSSTNQNETKYIVEDCQSPLVIISVYPKQESVDVIKTVTCCKGANTDPTSPSKLPSPERTRASSPKKNREKNVQLVKAVSQSRSPSPVEKNVYRQKHHNNKKQEETKVFTASKKKVSTNYQTTQPYQINRNVNRKSAVMNKPVINSPCKTEVVWQQTTNKNKNQSTDKKTEQMLAKQALVDDFTKRITESMNRRAANDRDTVKNGTSKVIINIDSENENYDVLFQQGKLTTDVTVRRNKKVSPRMNLDHTDGTRSPPSIAFKRESDDKWRYEENKTQANVDMVEENLSRLNVRDSLEILHRRDTDQNLDVIKTHPRQKRRNENTVDNNFLGASIELTAPIKHYRGDDCNLTDPIERDKQIRELLGIETRVVSSSETRQCQGYNVDDNYDGYLQCIMNECKEHLPVNLHEPKECSGNCDQKDSPKQPIKRNNANPKDQKMTTKCNRDNRTQYDQGPVERNLYQQLILNRNIQVFLQVDQFNKQKPIILSQQQYDKIKRTIQDTLNKKLGRRDKGKKCFCKTSIVSISEVREKIKQEVTDTIEKGVQATKDKSKNVSGLKSSKLLKWINKDKEVRSLVLSNSNDEVLCIASKKVKDLIVTPTRHTVSSVEIRYTSVGMKRTQFSTSKSETTSHLRQTRSDSLIIIYKGPKKSLTPNLGTSVVSDGGSDTKSVKFPMAPRDIRPKKPFLQRLISCLIVHSTRDSKLKTLHGSVPLTPSVNSSIDSYHISSSREIEITSSLYDTSASFYSDHSILQVNNKMKKGFFSSVREFLTSRKS